MRWAILDLLSIKAETYQIIGMPFISISEFPFSFSHHELSKNCRNRAVRGFRDFLKGTLTIHLLCCPMGTKEGDIDNVRKLAVSF